MESFKKNYIQNDKNLQIFTIDNFVREEECEYLCALIKKTSIRSTVASTKKDESAHLGELHPGRTSYTSTLSDTDPIVSILDERMSNILNISKKHGESFQGQIYDVGQEFKHHYDWFDESSYNAHCLHSGQRLWTFMLYLNDVEEGGETDFPEINTKFTPKKGMAVVWKNSDGKGKEYRSAFHAGLPVKQGKKIIVTKWYRENEWNPAEDIKLSIEYHKKLKKDQNKDTDIENKEFINVIKKRPNTNIQQNTDIIKFKNKEDLPKLSNLGFEILRVPPKTWNLIQDTYKLLESKKIKENWEGIEKIIYDDNGNAPVDILSLDQYSGIKDVIIDNLQPLHELFIGYKEKIQPMFIYGIRSYKHGAKLATHTDKIATHHVSSIIIVDTKLNKEWPLDIQGHDGRWYKVYAEPGDMILYESAVCLHGRSEAFDGEYFRNMFVHYKLSRYSHTM